MLQRLIAISLLCGALFGLGVVGAAQTSDRTATILAEMEDLRRKAELPALAAAYVTTEGLQGIWTRGVRRAGGEAAIERDDLWHLGSCTKSMTATLIALLVARGDLEWDLPLGELLPDLIFDMDPAYMELTLVELLTHRAGIVPNPTRMGQELVRDEEGDLPRLVRERAVLARDCLTRNPINEPGTTFLYSNAGYMIAGHAAEVATGKSWEELMRELLFEPLGMKSAGFGPPGNTDRVDQPRGHDPTGKAYEPGPDADNPAVIGPAGTVHASLEDWAKYIQLHLKGHAGDVQVGDLTLTRETFARMHTPAEDQTYALGWLTAERAWAGGDGQALWHNGSNTMWFALTWLGLENGVAALVVTNRFTRPGTAVADQLIERLIQLHASEAPLEQPASQNRNVVVYITDDQGTAVGCYGDPDAKTPALDALAQDGVRFTRAFCTTASCSPSRAALLSGQHGHTNGMYGLQHAKHHFESFGNVRSLPARLADAGYVTARVGKYHVAPAENYPFEHALKGGSPVGMAERVRAFLKEKDERPFFLYFGTHEPHRGGGVAKEIPGQPNRFGNRDREDVERVRFDPDELTLPHWLPDSTEARAEWAQFHESSNRADQGFGRLCQVLQEEGVWDETLVIFLSDHGPPFPGAKTTVYEPGLHVPFVVRDPFANERRREVETLVSLLDVAPTILGWCGIDDAEGLQGRDLNPLLAGRVPEVWVDEIYASHTFHEVTMYYPMRVVRTPQYKLIWNIAHGLPFPFASDLWNAATWQRARKSDTYGARTVEAYVHRPRFELYDLRADPHEINNLAGDSEHAALLAELQGKLRAFQERTRDPWRLKWERE